MGGTSEVAPDTLAIDLTEGGIEVEYTDGREVFYHGVPEPVDRVTTPPGKDTHVLVTNADATHGVLTYVNERTTEDQILEDSGVGRVLLDRGEETSVFPGVTVQEADMRITVRADLDLVDGRVFVFAEDEMGESSWELVEDAEDTGGGGEASDETGADDTPGDGDDGERAAREDDATDAGEDGDWDGDGGGDGNRESGGA